MFESVASNQFVKSSFNCQHRLRRYIAAKAYDFIRGNDGLPIQHNGAAIAKLR